MKTSANVPLKNAVASQKVVAQLVVEVRCGHAPRRGDGGDDLEVLRGRPLSLDERETLTWCAVGKTAEETAVIMGVAEGRVVKRLNRAAAKLGCNRRIQAVTTALSAGLLIDIEQRMRINRGSVPSLTTTEIEYLNWCAQGKTSWETAQILHTGESAANFHLKRAIHKLDCVCKGQAVVKAMVLGLLDISPTKNCV